MNHHHRAVFVSCVALVALSGCSSGLPTTEFTNPAFDFSYVERAAVIPFDNLSQDSDAGVRVTRLMITELLASGAIEVVESGQVTAALAKVPGGANGRAPSLSTQSIIVLGQELGVQALIVGTVTQSEVMRSAGIWRPVVSIDVHMVETETGETVWAATHTETGATLGAKILGTGGKPISDTTRRTIIALLESLIE